MYLSGTMTKELVILTLRTLTSARFEIKLSTKNTIQYQTRPKILFKISYFLRGSMLNIGDRALADSVVKHYSVTQFYLNALNRHFIHFKLINFFLYSCQNIIFSILGTEYALNLTLKKCFK